MNRSQKDQVANIALDQLKSSSWSHTSTSHLYKAIKYQLPNWCSQAHLRQILNILRQKGTISRLGGEHAGAGKHKWKIEVATWDRLSPLGVQKGRTAIEHTEDEDDEVEETATEGISDEDFERALAEDTPDEDDTTPSTVDSKQVELLRSQIKVLQSRVSTLEENEQITKTNHETLAEEMDKLVAKTKELEEMNKRSVRTIKIEKWDGTIVKLKDAVLPANFDRVLDLAKCRRNILLVGPAGCGKSTLAKLIAKTLGLDFYKIGGSGGLSEEHFLGKSRPNLTGGKDRFLTTPFLEAFEKSGVCLVDELDGCDQNALLALNPALDGTGDLPIPNRETKPLAKKHPDFICIATANTRGKGADRMYAGRNQLDESTLSRFRIGTVECYYDAMIEATLCPDDEIREACQVIRKKIEQNNMRRVMDTRFIEDAYLMNQKVGWTKDTIIATYLEGWSAEERARVLAR